MKRFIGEKGEAGGAMRSQQQAQEQLDARQLCADLALMVCTWRRRSTVAMDAHTPQDWSRLGLKTPQNDTSGTSSSAFTEHTCAADDISVCVFLH